MMVRISRAFSSVRMLWRRLRRDQSGSVVTFLVVIPALMGAVAVGIETGQLYRTKRQMQGAADAGALAGSIDRMNNANTGTITATARYEAQRNGFQHGVGGVTVAVNAPATGTYASTTGSVEVIVSKSQSLGLVSALGNITMSSRAVAAQGSFTSTTSTSSGEGCLVALTTGNEPGVSFTSFNSFNADCTIISNGSATATGSGASVYMASFNNATLKSVWTRGRFASASFNHLTLSNPTTALENQTSTIADPYLSLATPAPGTCTYNPFNAPGGSSITLTEGVYCGGLTVSSYSNVYFTPGTYYIANGDLYLTSVNNVTCPTCTADNGVTFVLTQTTGNNANIGGVRISSDNNVTLNAPSTRAVSTSTNHYTYPGVLFYQDRRVANGTMSSTSKIFTISSLNTATLNGAIYFPNNRIDISSLNNAGSSTTGCTVWIGRYIKFSSYNNNYIAGCTTMGTNPAAIITTTTTTTNKGKVYE